MNEPEPVPVVLVVLVVLLVACGVLYAAVWNGWLPL